jgi:hypothetical protein
MADRREMSTGIRKAAGLAILLALASIALAACGSGEETTTTTRPPVSSATADHLAKLSDRVASDLNAGETCSAAIAADDLQDAVHDARMSTALRPGVEAVATDLVNQVNCPPPPPPPEPEKKPKKPKKNEGDEHGNGDEHGPSDENGQGGDGKPGHSDHGGFVPPGHAKLKGEGG